MTATFPEIRTAGEELRLMRSHMRCYAISWREHRNGMEKQAKIELMYAKMWRDEALKFQKGN